VSDVASIRIGAWVVRPDLNLLERDGRSVRIEPRAMDVLVMLARHGGAVVSIDELMASVWKGVVVGEGSVYLAIRQLRQAFGDADDGTRHIETIPKRGYRLTVPVELVEPVQPVQPAPHPASAVVPAPISGSRKRGSWRVAAWFGAGLAGFALLLVFAVNFRNGGVHTAVPPSVAVLPFENLSSDPQQAYFADGITAELLSTLSRVGGLRVTGRASSFQFKGSNDDLRTIGAALGVDHVLRGSVRKAGDRVRISAQLSDARSGDQLWSRTYERKLDDIFVIQDEIARSVADALQVRLGVGELFGIGDVGRAPGMTRNVAAYDEYLHGMELTVESTPEAQARAIAHLQRAVALDPQFSIGWAGLHAACINGAFVVPARAAEWRQQGALALERARTLTPDAPQVLLETGIAESRRGHWLKAAAVFDQLQAASARYGVANQAHAPRGIFLLEVGRVHEAIPELERTRAEDPLVVEFAGFLSSAYLADGNLVGALAEVDRGRQLKGFETPLLRAGMIAALTTRNRAEIDRRLGLIPETAEDFRLDHALAKFIDAPAGAADELRRAAAVPERNNMLIWWAAYYHEPQLALDLLAKAAPEMGDTALLWQPMLHDVRKLPGFKKLVTDLGLVDYWRVHGWADFCHPLRGGDFTCD
jgi:TolB-like protein/DNA-binding winged helix-turn-helix (wHTH) protein